MFCNVLSVLSGEHSKPFRYKETKRIVRTSSASILQQKWLIKEQKQDEINEVDSLLEEVTWKEASILLIDWYSWTEAESKMQRSLFL